jgi:hypothetical protein
MRHVRLPPAGPMPAGFCSVRRSAGFLAWASPLGRQLLRRIGEARSRLLISSTLVLAVFLAACGPTWQVAVSRPDGTELLVDAALLADLHDFAEPLEGEEAIPLERVLLAAGNSVVDTLHVTIEGDGGESSFDWPSVAEAAWWLTDGSLALGDKRLRASRLEVEPPLLLDAVEASITDVAPTVAAALGLPAPSQCTGHPLADGSAERVALIFMDGFGYVRYTEALEEGLIPHLGAFGEPLLGLTTYPPITSVSTASLLTGSPPEVHGVNRRGIRITEVETLFDVATSAGLETVAVEGDSLAFNLRGADLQLSADLDSNGSTDDNVLQNALGVLAEGAPDLLYVHFHGIDDAGHTYGPGAPEECAAILEEDTAVGQIVELLPSGTLIVIFADHGMHEVDEEGRSGNHGQLVERDMFIPIFLVRK